MSVRTHGASQHPLYNKWRAMISRCHDERHGFYPRWGGRGITVCKLWREDVWAFIRWAENNGYAPGHQSRRCSLKQKTSQRE